MIQTVAPRKIEELAANLWPSLNITGYKQDEKREIFAKLLRDGMRALHANRVIRFSRENGEPNRAIRLQVIDAAVKAGFFHEERSPRGSELQSRLVPGFRLADVCFDNPWDVEPHAPEQFLVKLRQRTKSDEAPNVDLEFDRNDPVPAWYHERLKQINEFNAKCHITYTPLDEYGGEFLSERILRSVMFAVFTKDPERRGVSPWEQHGRIYTDALGHQKLSKIERRTIHFNGEPSVELDYSAMHPRMLYHLQIRKYKGDPYWLWDEPYREELKQHRAMRAVVKQVLNTAINAKSRESALKACNLAKSSRTRAGNKKQGEAAKKALRLRDACRHSGLKLSDVYDLIEERHPRLRKYLGTDYGIELMNIDGRIALGVMSAMIGNNIPCLGVHVSFIVPESHRDELVIAMTVAYEDIMGGFLPVIK